jgi:hypothetical protein
MIELSKIFRQKDEHFASLLNRIRINQDVDEAIDTLNAQYDTPIQLNFKVQKNKSINLFLFWMNRVVKNGSISSTHVRQN